MGGGKDGCDDNDDETDGDLSRSEESFDSESCDVTTSDDDTDYSTDESDDESDSSVSSSTVASEQQDDDKGCDCRWSGNTEDSSWNLHSSGVRDWTVAVPVGMNLCPWAKLAHRDGRIRYVACPETVQTPEAASAVLWTEISRLFGTQSCPGCQQQQHPTFQPKRLPPWSTTLVICPHVHDWTNNFEVFQRFVNEFGTNVETSPTLPGGAITLVPFHPQFLRWRGLPEAVRVGDPILCHKGLAGFSKSPEAHPATIVDLSPAGFGRRRVRVRFHEGNSATTAKFKTEQCVPVDWVVLEGDDNDAKNNQRRPPLPDNAMHRAPYPVIHILRTVDLEGLSVHDISRLKRRNAKRMASETLSS